MSARAPKPPCPICGDPNAYPLWADQAQPEACAADAASWHGGGPVTFRTVTECPLQMNRARQAAAFRKLVPDAFDTNGKMLPGQLARVLGAYAKAYPGRSVVL
ncbi:hypothetical protein MPPM_2611 [Methylorubrum populi]|uniref:Uncharacterized protein n=1 Tax=Methylorubrum populi TaxID=223967 RepID=A0A160PF30_9HYPH|nr:hypothetical protein [Methylorubrum populi]BAU91216.1 hypothetical protein MPPM_2611 [Methylorubrum populi]